MVGLIKVIDHDVQVELLRPSRVGPSGRHMIGGELKANPDVVSSSAMTTQSSDRYATGNPMSSE